MQLSGLDLFFWAAGLAAHAILLTVLLVRRRAVSFPNFTSLIGLSTLQTLVLYTVFRHGSRREYFATYWSFALCGQILEFLVVYELAASIFRPLAWWSPDVKRSSVVIALTSVFVAAGLAWLAAPPTNSLQQTLVMKGTLFSAALMSELFVGIIVLSVTVGLPWRTHVARIALALGTYSIVEILVYGADNVWGLANGGRVYTTLSHVRIGLYLSCLIYWIFALWQDAPVAQVLSPGSLERLALLQTRVGAGLGSLRSGREG